jgi:hypothetical protein
MLNPWLAFSIRATRLGWETQSMVVDQLMAMAGMKTTDRHAAGDACSTDSPNSPKQEPAAAATRKLGEAETFAQPRTEMPIHAVKNEKRGKVAQQVSNVHKKHSRAGKRRRSK